MRATGVILTGGKSRRFGSDKTILRWGDRTVVEKIAGQYAALFDEILLVGNPPGKFSIPGVREIEDIYPDAGPLGGIYSGLRRASNPRIFVTACDMPFFSGKLAAELLESSDDCDAVVPREGERVEPLFAVYNSGVLPAAERMLLKGERAVRLLYDRVRVKYLDLGEWAGQNQGLFFNLFFNINFPEDYRQFQILLTSDHLPD
ncbi:MAG: molybdenum cofactor guanylyltransferase [Synergistaceae bacterium]|jgi:molybdopterin-guanine dinucleotide biosynthesis protein A|nr:molybdenum cofactor guanylyltransferase [Synergistaceae bacterium]